MYIVRFCFASVSYVYMFFTVKRSIGLFITHQNSFFQSFAIIEDRIQYNERRDASVNVQKR